jgi:hypothetical protein
MPLLAGGKMFKNPCIGCPGKNIVCKKCIEEKQKEACNSN